MLTYNLTSEFKARAAGVVRPFTRASETFAQRFLSGAGKTALGAVAGWGGVMVVGMVMMSHASKEHIAPVPEAAPAIAAVETVKPPKASPAPAKADEAKSDAASDAKSDLAALAAAPAAPAPSPVAAKKSTQRIDMTPTASIAEPAKPKHRHRKKAGEVDKHP